MGFKIQKPLHEPNPVKQFLENIDVNKLEKDVLNNQDWTKSPVQMTLEILKNMV